MAELAEVSEALAEASQQRAAVERDNRFLMRELAHRSKNQMAVIGAMAKQTARGANDVNAYVQALERRIMGLARSTDLLLAHGRAAPRCANWWTSRSALSARPTGASRFPARTSASIPRARRSSAWRSMSWPPTPCATAPLPSRRTHQPRLDARGRYLADRLARTLARTLEPSGRTGFGTTVLRSMVGGSLGASVEHIVHADGIEWRFAIPLGALDPAFAAARPDEDRPGQ